MTWRFHLNLWPWVVIGMAYEYIYLIPHTSWQGLLMAATGMFIPAWLPVGIGLYFAIKADLT